MDRLLPRYIFRSDQPSLWAMARRGVSDIASVVPDAILHEPAVQLPGSGAPLIVADPGLVREVLNDRHGRFTRDRLMRRLFRRSWGDGIAGAEGAPWQRQRRAAASAFRPAAVEQQGAAFAAIAERAVSSWPVGERIDLTQQAARIVAEVVFSVLVDGAGLVDPATVASDMPAYIRRIAGFGLKDVARLPESVHDRLSGIDRDPAVRRIKAAARILASNRRADSRDMIALLRDVGPIEDNIRGLLPAAMDTTVVGLSWTLYILAAQPEWQARVAAEARANDGCWTLDQIPITLRVVKEALRLYPPAPFLVRSAAASGTLGGFPIRKGQPISLSIYAMHRHHRSWPDPDHFDPDRFLPEAGSTPAWMPFGVGPRSCIAAQFALAEIAVIAARLLADLKLHTLEPAPELTLSVACRSATGLHIIAKRREQ
ncbi:cytochrome P450 [Sphingomonas sp. Leaf33]|uniref:cytochrome P450 n=1 Tax=Sphingomonas sp. Leaf33 TaxID=1736215 RepID=UPI000A824E98|nr:cytochrome P450 [Sphingomonas sp. Leaf33]